ncbi:histidine kinase [Chryseobacterium sp. MEBOG06]|uniref:histidine kinase n=1 Tax=unclassified Chryseobacterium TaxID=2593645 RepID=UPI001F472759|nr:MULTISPECIES: histidine kinase [unclassified Chryseobacterium]UKB85769.1 histidine kinase [Chryseobacterium sp. MEBOG06]
MHNLLFLLTLLTVLAKPIIRNEEPVPVYKTGDNKEWAAKDFDDKDWSQTRGNTSDRIFWSRTHIEIRQVENQLKPLGLQIQSFGSFEVYWDGELIGRNGHLPQQGKPEIPGTESSYYRIPDHLASPGFHTVALRSSQSFLPDVQRSISFKMNSYTALLTKPLVTMSYMNLMAGAFLIAAVYYFFLYLNSKRRQWDILIFGSVCFLFCALLIIEYLKFHVFIPYPDFFVRLEIVGWLTFANALLVPLYFIIQFNFKKGRWLMAVLLISLILLYIIHYGSYDLTARLYSLAMLIAAFIVVLNGIVQKEKGGFIALAALLISALINKFVLYDYGLFISFTVIVLSMLYLHSIRASVIEAEHQNAVLLSSRLQLELLKKNIQPHFLRNTLTSMMDWVEESPREGSRFIQALAAEFDIMNEISEQTLIPITKELELCRQHISIMGFRKEINYQWEEIGIDEKQLIPPAIIHTLLENGITHSEPLAGNTVKFVLSYALGKKGNQYTFETFAKNRKAVTNRSGGNGFKYIKARLTESYGQKWTFDSVAAEGGWISTIYILKQ